MASNGAHHQRAMVVVAHADDAEWGCAGTVAKWCAEGWEVVYVLCTDGSKGSEDPEMTSGRLVEIRKQEQLDAGKVLGLKDIVFLGYEDSMLEPTLELRRDIAREIRRHRPDVLICMNPVRSVDGEGYLGHPDHFASGEAALSAVFPSSRDRLTFPELLREGLEPHKVKEVWMMFHGDTADKFVDVSAYMDTAVDALKAHQTQVSEEDAEVDMRQWRNSTGKKVGFEFAEAFKVFQLE